MHLALEPLRAVPEENAVMAASPVYGGPAAKPFTAALHAAQFSPGDYVRNNYSVAIVRGEGGYGLLPPNSARYLTDPFIRYRNAHGDRFLERIWEWALQPPAEVNHQGFSGVLQAGLCTGLAGVTALAYERYRLKQEGVSLSRRPSAEVLEQALWAQLQVLTAPFLRHCWWALREHPRQAVAWLREFRDPAKYFRPMLMLIPTFALTDLDGFKRRVEFAHSLFLHRFELVNGGIRGQIWDPNLPDQDAQPFEMSAEGEFSYQTHFDSPCRIVSQNVKDVWGKDADGKPSPTLLGAFRAVPVPLNLLFHGQKLPVVNALSLIVG